ncbi:MAG TPA: Mur ligase family protein [Bacteroidales bacterium]|nr:Mur ligase family protein [Bacteroidales bacterium]
MKIHFISIAGSAMHNLAIALKKKGYNITGSDDEIFEPARSNLQKYNLLPPVIGWRPEILDNSYDAVILGMHAKSDNPELQKALELGLKVFSYPEYLYEQSKNKKRIVIGGSHGKTTITAMILHILKDYNIDTDYMVGAKLKGFDVMVKLSDAPYIVLEGDEYLTSAIDKRPKFHLYMPHIAVVSGIAWDHINVFPSFEKYIEQFKIFINLLPDKGVLIYPYNDEIVKELANSCNSSIIKKQYSMPDYKIINGKTYLIYNDERYELKIFGKHNLLNINAARLVCNELGINNINFYKSITSFEGASMRLEKIIENENYVIFRDFAHSPSKLKATINAVKEQYPDNELVACIELHTFSSLSKSYLQQYENSMNLADKAIVFYTPHALQLKKLPDIEPNLIIKSFNKKELKVITDKNELLKEITNTKKHSTILLMSSGNFDGLELNFIKNLYDKATN